MSDFRKHYEKHRNNYYILHKIWYVQEKIEIGLIFSYFKFWFLIYIQIASKCLKLRSDPFQSTPGIKYSSVKNLFRFNAGKVPFVKISTFANVLMFIFYELKDIPFGEWLLKNSIMSSIGLIIPFHLKLGPLKNRSGSSSFSHFLSVWFLIDIH